MYERFPFFLRQSFLIADVRVFINNSLIFREFIIPGVIAMRNSARWPKVNRYALGLCLVMISIPAIAQDDIPSPTADPGGYSSNPIPTGLKEVKTRKGKVVYKKRDELSGSGFLLIAPQIDGGFISTSPKSESLFSRIESSASGWLVEPKLGFGLLNQSIALDLLFGVQTHSLTGSKTGVAESYEVESAQVTPLNPAEGYSAEQTIPLVEGSARLRVGAQKKFSIGLSGSGLFGASKAIYSSVPEQGLKFAFFAGPQFAYQEQFGSSFLRLSATVQLLTTDPRRSGYAFKVGASYSNLLNKPQLVERERKIVKEEITTQRRIVSKREQVLIQKENVSFIFNDQMINFKFNSFELTEKSQQFVSGLGQIFAAQHSDWQSLTVEGHTDSKGGNEYNKRLSQRRAQSVRDILVANGVPSVSVIAVGRGEENLLVKNEQSDVDFARNRRVEIKIQGLRNARLLQRSIKRLERELFGRSMSTSGSETDESAE